MCKFSKKCLFNIWVFRDDWKVMSLGKMKSIIEAIWMINLELWVCKKNWQILVKGLESKHFMHINNLPTFWFNSCHKYVIQFGHRTSSLLLLGRTNEQKDSVTICLWKSKMAQKSKSNEIFLFFNLAAKIPKQN